MLDMLILPETRLSFGSDLHLRNHWFIPASMGHPAKLHLGLLSWLIDRYTRPGETIADPMAGIGSLLYAATMQRNVIACEIEPCWLEIAHQNAAHILYAGGLFVGEMMVGQHDACTPWGYQADHIIFSPPYGNEISTTKNGHRGLCYAQKQEKGVMLSPRWEYMSHKQTCGTMASLSFHYGTHPAQVGHFRNKRYWEAMTDIYRNAYDALRGHGYCILILRDHIADGKRVETYQETIKVCQGIGFLLVDHHQRHLSNLSLWQRRRREQGLPVIEEEDILVFSKGDR